MNRFVRTWRMAFPARDVREAEQAVHVFFDGYDTLLARDLRGKAVRLLRRIAEIPDGVDPLHAGLRAAQAVAYREISSGEHHIYAGTLSMKGLEYLNTYAALWKAREAVGDRLAHEVAIAVDMEQVRQAIRAAG